ncbi:MAG: Holliday junction branch migration DNA helicase RuvB, partial [Thiotrichales bacterium]|nr:Holliday junction branch migration DNA helicase RuvB [Thiotrichales bacterium]
MIETDRIIGSQESSDDIYAQPSVRPTQIHEYIGQKAVREQLQLSMDAAKMRN